jgi:hypothetical protein
MVLVDVARDTAASPGARVQAARVLTDVFLLRAKGFNDLKRFRGWTDDELEDFNQTKAIPPWIAEITGVRTIDDLLPAKNLRTGKTSPN